ncbi:MAG: YDG domain-containing protein [Bacteroidota bacterium]
MKNHLHKSILLGLMISVSITAIGQYTGPNPNVAALKLATALDSVTGFEPSKAVDNSLIGYCAIPGDAPVWLQVDLGSFHFIDGYGMILPKSDELPLTYTIQGSANGSYWTNIKHGTTSEAGPYYENLTWPGEYRYVRIYITEKDALASITEFYIYGHEIFPPTPPLALPASNIIGESFTANWSERSTATGYTLSVATDYNFTSPVPGYDNLDVGDVLNWEVTGLSPVTTYYYLVEANNASGSSGGSNKVTVTTLKKSQTITFNSLPESSYGEIDFDLTAEASSGLMVSYTSSDENVATVSNMTVTIVGPGTTTITASQAGDSEYEAASPVPQDLIVNPKELTVTGAVAENKVYDGLTDALLSGAVLNGLVGADDVSLADATSGTFAQADAGAGISVTTAMTITGADAANYSITQPTDLVADITARELTVTGATAADKVYDGTTDASISGGTLNGVLGDDIVNLTDANFGTFAQSDVGTDLGVSTAMTLSGAAAGNYSVTQPVDIVASITVKDLTVTLDDKSREACQPNPDFTILYSGFVGAEDASVLVSEPTGSSSADESSAPGTYDITLSGGEGGNYNLVFEIGTLTIIPDVTDPVLSVQDITIKLDDTGNASITPADVVSDATDDCGVADTTLSQDTFTSSDVGDVTVEVTVTDAAGNSTTAFSTVTVQDPTGLAELSAIGVNIFPNPTNGLVELELNSSADMLSVMDMTGKTVITRFNLNARETIDLSEYSNGIYIFQLKLGDDLRYIKVIKK